VEVEGIQAILAAMKRFPTSDEIQYHSLQALINLSSNGPTAKIMVLETDGVAQVIKAMKKFPDCTETLAEACTLLSILSEMANLTKPLRDANVRTALVAAMDRHKEDESIQKLGGEAMTNLCK
jgi:hypothetical protein